PSSLGGPVSMLSTYRVPGGFDVKVVATVAKGTLDEMTAQKGTLVWKFGGPGPVAQATVPAPRAAAMASDARVATQSNVYDTANYNGRKVDFNVKDIDIKNLLGAIAEISKKNIIVADDVKGSVTIKLRNVPWDQALDIILKSTGLGREDVGNIIRVAPIETLRAEQKSAAEAFRNRQAAEPLKVRLIPVNYARAEQLTTQLKDTLSERGTVSVDTRTNTLIVKDVQDALLRAEGVVRNLDTQTPEVLIEARIVEAATSFARQAGIQWGGNISMAPTFGNPTGLIFPNILAVAGAAGVATSFIEARLELRVTPHVTQEGSIQMKISATNNQPNPQLTGSNGQPSISRREAKTEVLVRDGETTVIGGIYTRRNSEAWNEVPVLSKIPVL